MFIRTATMGERNADTPSAFVRSGSPVQPTSSVVVLAAALVALAPGLAHADVRARTDPRGDVQYLLNSDPSSVPPPVAAPARTQGDISVVRVTHGPETVRVVIYFRALARAGQSHGHVFRFASGNFQRKVQIAAGPEAPRGWKGYSEMFTTSDRLATCRGLTHQVDYTHRRVVLNVPRTCLRTPAAVKVGAGTVVLANSRTYFDDGYQAAGTMGLAALRPTLGPAVPR